MNIEKLKELWEKSNDKYADAKRIKTTYQTMYNIIYRGSICKVDLLDRISKFFNVPIGYFFDEPSASFTQKKKNNVAGNQNGITVSDCEIKLSEAKKEIEHLRKMLEEKERTIQILMKKQQFRSKKL
ncbi:MAG: helix-turn-helix domain-containing protein [Prevotellaceae bacterium]|jgi:hypothetical protein|nr:helix-turn-helix domain-containing protein [Prevotellaceae bacterium]